MITKNKHSAVVIIGAVVISAGILLYTSLHQDSGLSYKTFKIQNGWGYNILSGKKVIIHQETIPAVAGLGNFQSEQQAEKTAELVMKKIQTGGLPSVTNTEMKEILKGN